MPIRRPAADAASSVFRALIFLFSLLCNAANAQQSLPDTIRPDNWRARKTGSIEIAAQFRLHRPLVDQLAF
jgi:hypothetical protein